MIIIPLKHPAIWIRGVPATWGNFLSFLSLQLEILAPRMPGTFAGDGECDAVITPVSMLAAHAVASASGIKRVSGHKTQFHGKKSGIRAATRAPGSVPMHPATRVLKG
jgi:hypothetical protein